MVGARWPSLLSQLHLRDTSLQTPIFDDISSCFAMTPRSLGILDTLRPSSLSPKVIGGQTCHAMSILVKMQPVLPYQSTVSPPCWRVCSPSQFLKNTGMPLASTSSQSSLSPVAITP